MAPANDLLRTVSFIVIDCERYVSLDVVAYIVMPPFWPPDGVADSFTCTINCNQFKRHWVLFPATHR